MTQLDLFHTPGRPDSLLARIKRAAKPKPTETKPR